MSSNSNILTNIKTDEDVGGSYFLSHGKVKGALGMYLALTGARLAAADTLFCGFATHFIPTASLPNFEVVSHFTTLK